MGRVKKKVQKSSKYTKLERQARAFYAIERAVGDPDMIAMVTKDVRFLGGDKVASVFATTPAVLLLVDKPSRVQRIMLNAYMRALLFKHRVDSGKPVYEVLKYINNEYQAEDWLTVYQKVVLPFVINNKIF